MTHPIRASTRPFTKQLLELIDEHNERVVSIWVARGSACKPFQSPNPAPSAVDLSRVVTVDCRRLAEVRS